MLVNTTTHDNIGRVLFPSMNFTCDGKITKLTFLAVQGLFLTDLQFGLGHLVKNTISQRGASQMDIMNASKAILISSSGTGYELRYEVTFQAGDVLSVHQLSYSQHHLLHQVNEVIETCTVIGTEGRGNVSCTIDGGIGRPFVAVETGIV